MASPIRPQPRTGPAGAYDEAIRGRELMAVEWLGLDLQQTSRIRAIGGRTDGLTAVYEVVVHGGPQPTRGRIIGTEYSGDESGVSLQIELNRGETAALAKHLGPLPEPPQFVSLWNARAGDLKPGMKLYDEQGNVVGEVGDVVRGTGRVGGVAFGVFDG